jgi:hypothetical protein
MDEVVISIAGEPHTGARSIKMALFLTFWSSAEETPTRRNGS